MDLEQALRATPAVREFGPLPVPDQVVYEVLEVARFAPSGGNRQAWRVALVKDPAVRAALGELYRSSWYRYLAMVEAGLVPWAPITDRQAEDAALARAEQVRAKHAHDGGLAERFEQLPAILALAADLRALAAVDRDLDRYSLVGGASVYPFAWSVLLAARGRGLAGVITTMASNEEPRAAEVLHLPDGFAVCAVIALGYPAKPVPTRLKRAPVESFAHLDTFDGPPLLPKQ
jgi:nitroreductase